MVDSFLVQNRNCIDFFQVSRCNLTGLLFLVKKIIRCDVVHCSGVSFLGVIAIILGRILKKGTSFTMHGCLMEEAKYRKIVFYRMHFERLLLKFSNVIIPVSHSLERVVINYYKVPKNKFHIIKNGVVGCSDIIKAKNKNTVVCIGGGRREKGIKSVCEAIDSIKKEHGLNLKLIVFGEYGPDSDYINSFEFVDNRGFVPYEEIIDELKYSKVFVQYSLYESFSLSVFDALYQGCKVIASDRVGAVEYIDNTPMLTIVNLGDEKYLLKSILNGVTIDVMDRRFTHSCGNWDYVYNKYFLIWSKIGI